MSTAQLGIARPDTRAAARPVRRPTDGTLRLTRRGRVVILVSALLIAFGGFVAFGPSVIATDESGPKPATITVHPGETLWEIAGRVNPDGDVRSTVDDIAELNGVSDAGELQMGTELAVPRY
ncbi:LysM peptidoglycan-binding domain-containing protein [Solicola gregarius]|uniref:LysM domain-containing protein n=1 Tax=Solicola gregarius TaxID=2908642 RepID=A0AA46TFW0_9ACTN|nr:LysM domain-containing protein [Solicola gregarius]UYM04597.1 LysM domain-containing protein [Solicola gregarius]